MQREHLDAALAEMAKAEKRINQDSQPLGNGALSMARRHLEEAIRHIRNAKYRPHKDKP